MSRAPLRAVLTAALFVTAVSCTSDRAVAPAELKPALQAALVTDPPPLLVITEIMADPSKVADASGEWFEVYNAGTTDVNLKDYKISSGVAGETHVISTNVVVAAGGYVVFGNNANTTTNGGVTENYSYPTSGTGSIVLNNSTTDWLVLRTPADVQVDSVAYSARPSGPNFTPSAGIARALVNVALDNTIIASNTNWVNAATSALYGAGDRGTPGSGPYTQINAGPVATVSIDPSPASVVVGKTLTLKATGFDANGFKSPTTFTYSSSDATVATVSATGVVTGVKEGTATVTATSANNISGTTEVTVGAPLPVITVTLTPAAPINITTGKTLQFTATGKDVNDQVTPTTFTWLTAHPLIATVNATGLVTGVKEGTTTLSVTSANNVTVTVDINIIAPIVNSVSVSVDTSRVPVGFVKRAFVTVRDVNGATITPAPPVTWTSSATDIATIDSLGYITALAAGQTVLQATAANGKFGTWHYTVLPAFAPTSAQYKNPVEFGVPTDANPGDDIIVVRPQYELSYNAARGGPNWVSWDLNATEFGDAARCNCFSPDLSLPTGVYRVSDFDYVGSGYDRGHMVQSESRTTTNQENAATFILSQILPQSSNNNSGPWGKLENHLNDLARAGKQIYVIAGGQYAPNPQTLKNEHKVAIPDYTWKVAVIMNAGQGLANVTSTSSIQVIAVRMPNLLETTTSIRNDPWESYVTTVDAIEAAVGYDVLAALPDQIELQVESNDRPPVARVTAPTTALEGATVHFDASTSSDPDGDALTYTWSFGDGSTATGTAPTHTYADNGTYTVTLTATDPIGVFNQTTANIAVQNVAPVITSFTVPTTAGAVTASAHAQLTFTDAGSADTHTVQVNWGDGTTSTATASNGTVDVPHTYATAGLFSVSVTLTDDDGATASAATTGNNYVVVYDANAGFVTGGGWIAGQGGKAFLELEARYASGADTPAGKVNFRAKNDAVVFNSETLDWLMVSDARATLRGTGTLANQPGTYQFLVTVTDPEGHGKAGKGGFRVKIVSESGVVIYDNQAGESDQSSAVTSLGGGQITIH